MSIFSFLKILLQIMTLCALLFCYNSLKKQISLSSERQKDLVGEINLLKLKVNEVNKLIRRNLQNRKEEANILGKQQKSNKVKHKKQNMEAGDGIIQENSLEYKDFDIISNCEDIQEMEMNNEAASYLLKENIDCGGISLKRKRNSGVFKGKLFGRGYKISNFSISCSIKGCGLFLIAENCHMKDIVLENFNIHSISSKVGGLIGECKRGCKLENIKVSSNGNITNLISGQSQIGLLTILLSMRLNNTNLRFNLWISFIFFHQELQYRKYSGIRNF